MILSELIDIILYLRPNAQFSCWDTQDIKEYHGELSPPKILDNKFIDWSPTNISTCPTQHDVDRVNKTLVKEAAISRYKNNRDISLKQDKSIVASYRVAKMVQNNITWREFLDSLDEEIE